MNKLLDKLLLLTFPFMDVGFVVFGIPLRFGEIIFLLFFLRLLDLKMSHKLSRVNQKGVVIVFLLLANLFLVILVTSFSTVDDSHYFKYIARNGMYFLAMSSFLIKPLQVDRINGERFIRYIFYVIAVFYFLEFIDYYLMSLNWDSIFVARQGKNVFRGIIIRFAGPASEGGHLIPLLSIPLMYGLLARKKWMTLFSLAFILLTFSSFGYLVIAFSIFFFFKKEASKDLIKRMKKIIVNGFAIVLFVGVLFAEKVSTLIAYNWEKAQAYFRVSGAKEWSASQRTNHIKLAFDLFWESPWYRMLFGNGTGYYSKKSKEFTKFYLDEASEAHSLYFSTLPDRGIIGLLLIFTLFFVISRIRIPKNIQDQYRLLFLSIKFGVLVKIVHWMFVGMVWQYYFWVEVVLLLSLSIYYNRRTHERK